jgi:GNAT superfamily N-acetyltransferase
MSQLAKVRTMHPRPMWESFALALGPKELLACYGWDAVPADARWGETVYTFHLADGHGVVVGWSSLAKYPKEPDVFELAIGVWPAHQGNGYRRDILKITAAVAFVDHGAEQVVMLVLDSCTKHAAQCLRDAETGSPWVYSGRVWHGDPLRSFTLTREAWVSEGRS